MHRFSVLSLLMLVLLATSALRAQDFADEGFEESGAKSRSPWGVSYFNYSTSPQEAVDKGSGSWNIYQYVSLNYKLSRNTRFHIRPAFSIQTPGFDERDTSRPFETRDNDFHIAFSQYQMLPEGSDYDLVGRYYAYLPTTKSSQSKKWVTRLRAWMTLERYFTKDFYISYNFKPDYYVNTQKAYKTDTSYGGKTDNNQIGALDHYFEIGYKLNKWFYPQVDIGAMHEWYHSSDEADSMPALIEQFKIAPNTWINVTRDLRFIAGIEYDYNIKTPRLGNPDTVTYYILTFATFL